MPALASGYPDVRNLQPHCLPKNPEKPIAETFQAIGVMTIVGFGIVRTSHFREMNREPSNILYFQTLPPM